MAGQRFGFSIGETACAETAGVRMYDLHFDVDAICRAYEAIVPLAERLEVDAPRPRLAGFCYPHLAALGAGITFAEDGEPNVEPLIASPAEIDGLSEPEDYLAAPIIRKRLALMRKLKTRRPDAAETIGHLLEGPVTTAMLLMGQQFLMLPYDDPKRAHRLLDFCVTSALNYAKAIKDELGHKHPPVSHGFPDDFAGMFPPHVFREFVAPYWRRLFEGLGAPERNVHSELLRVEHLPFLKELDVAFFDPSADQYLTPELCRKHCPVPFHALILAWHVRDMSAKELVEMYRRWAALEPCSINFNLSRLEDEPKITALLEVAREMAEV